MTIATTTPTALDRRIVALSDRWVFIGYYHAATSTGPAYLSEASCIREWGTSAGLGEIALTGPTPKTKLDPCGILVLDNPASVIFSIRCTYD
jgi:hypothetical protein